MVCQLPDISTDVCRTSVLVLDLCLQIQRSYAKIIKKEILPVKRDGTGRKFPCLLYPSFGRELTLCAGYDTGKVVDV